jgi:hypothetical protein
MGTEKGWHWGLTLEECCSAYEGDKTVQSRILNLPNQWHRKKALDAAWMKDLSDMCHQGYEMRGVLPSVLCLKVWSWSLEKWGSLGPQGVVEPLEKKVTQLITEAREIRTSFNISGTYFYGTQERTLSKEAVLSYLSALPFHWILWHLTKLSSFENTTKRHNRNKAYIRKKIGRDCFKTLS